jgi:1,4-alpha-glucan branching enzyme
VPLVVKDTLAEEVRVTGDFTDWVPEGIRLSHDGDGLWRTVLSLEPGEHQYRLLVDGKWKDHAEATGHAANPFGSVNCVLKVM